MNELLFSLCSWVQVKRKKKGNGKGKEKERKKKKTARHRFASLPPPQVYRVNLKVI